MSPRQRAARGRASASRPVAPVEPVELVVDGLVVRLARKRIKNLNLRVHRGGGFVEVSAPAYVRDRDIERFVREKRPWIDAKLAQVAASPAAVAAEARAVKLGRAGRTAAGSERSSPASRAAAWSNRPAAFSSSTRNATRSPRQRSSSNRRASFSPGASRLFTVTMVKLP